MVPTITISFGDDHKKVLIIPTHDPLDDIRFHFNPSGIPTVNTIKALAAAFLTVAEKTAIANPACAREMAVARTHMQTASMWAVLGATAGH